MEYKDYGSMSSVYNYMLFIFDLNKGKNVIKYLANSLIEIKNSEHIKYYTIDDNNMVIHFDTSMRYDQIVKTINSHTQDIYRYMLMPFDDLVTLGIEEVNIFEFAALKDESTEILDDEDESDFDMEEYKVTITSFLQQLSKQKLSLDDILDKINKTGIDSLTKEEFDYLNNF